MATNNSKSVASRLPIELYFEILNEANEKGFTISDYVCYILSNRQLVVDLTNKLKNVESKLNIAERNAAEASARYIELERTIESNDERRKYALGKLTNYLERQGIKPTSVAEVWNAWY